MFEVKKAKRQRRPLKINLEGVSGSGKTFTALRLAFAMRRAGVGKRIVVVDSENDSAGLYEGINIDGERWEYEVCPMPRDKQNPPGYSDAYEYLVSQGFDIIIGDSLTHAWYGAQEQVDRYAAANKNDKFGGWAKVTPQQRDMLAKLTDNRAHFIGTMRVKSEYEKVMNERTGREQMKKVGTKTDQREGAEYEFDCVVRLDKGSIPTEHVITVEKVRGCTTMDGRTGVNPGPEFWKPLLDWWLSAETTTTPTQLEQQQPPKTPAPDERHAIREQIFAEFARTGREPMEGWTMGMRWLSSRYPAEAAKYTPKTRAIDVEVPRLKELLANLKTHPTQGAA